MSYVPDLNAYAMLSDIGNKISNGFQQYQKQQTLSQLGDMIAQGDYNGAAQLALRNGNMDVGLKLAQYGDQRKNDSMLAGLIPSIGGVAATGSPAISPSGSSPLSGDGYNYNGMSPDFSSKLDKFIEDNPYIVTMTDGFRTRAQQADLYARKPGLAAPPGHSNHERGTAADLGFENPAAQEWAHNNAAAYGLSFPMLSNAPGRKYEPWHVEMANNGGRVNVASLDPSAGVTGMPMQAVANPDAPQPPVRPMAYAPNAAQAAGGPPQASADDGEEDATPSLPSVNQPSARPARPAAPPLDLTHGSDPYPQISMQQAVMMANSPTYKTLGEQVLKAKMEAQSAGRDIPITDPGQRAQLGIAEDDTRPIFYNQKTGKVTFGSESKATENKAEADKPRVVSPGGAIWQGGKEVYRNTGGGNMNARSAIAMYMQKYVSEHPEATSEEIGRAAQQFGAQNAAYTRFTSGPQGNTVRSFNVLVDHLGVMKDAATALGNGDLKTFNRIAQRWAEETGNPAPTNFEATRDIVGDELVKAVIGSGSGALGDRESIKARIANSNSPAQLIGAINQYRKLGAGQLNGLKLQYNKATGRDDFEDFLFPGTKDYFTSVSSSHSGASPGGQTGNSAPLKTKTGVTWSPN